MELQGGSRRYWVLVAFHLLSDFVRRSHCRTSKIALLAIASLLQYRFLLFSLWVTYVDFNQITILGRVDRPVEFFTSQSGIEIASFIVATSTGWKDKHTGEWKKNVQWHHVTTYQPGVVALLRSRCKKGMRIFIQAQMSYRGYRRPGEATSRVSADVKIGPGDTLIFLSADGQEMEIDLLPLPSNAIAAEPAARPTDDFDRSRARSQPAGIAGEAV